jgi:hypothetical protein
VNSFDLQLVLEMNDAIIEQARATGLNQLCLRADTITPEQVDRLHAEGFVVRAWGMTTELLMQQVGKDPMA